MQIQTIANQCLFKDANIGKEQAKLGGEMYIFEALLITGGFWKL